MMVVNIFMMVCEEGEIDRVMIDDVLRLNLWWDVER